MTTDITVGQGYKVWGPGMEPQVGIVTAVCPLPTPLAEEEMVYWLDIATGDTTDRTDILDIAARVATGSWVFYDTVEGTGKMGYVDTESYRMPLDIFKEHAIKDPATSL